MATKDEEYPPVLPPPYEAKAYAHHRQPHFRRRVGKAFSVPVFLAPILTLSISCLFIVLGRRVVLDGPPAKAFTSPVSPSKFEAGLKACAVRHARPAEPMPEARETNSRWNAIRGQGETIILRNATLFDGESFLPGPVDIRFSKGLINSVTPASNEYSRILGVKEFDLQGRYVMPGLVDMHSHHTIGSWPGTSASEDVNEINPMFGTLAPFLRIIDSMKAYDKSAEAIASGEITTSLILPGSANTMGGEGTVIKNVLKSRDSGEYVVEEMLLERDVPMEADITKDHFFGSTNAKHLLSQAAIGHSFHLPAEKALQALDSHPLSIGATPQQVFIDGVATLKSEDVEHATGSSLDSHTAPSTPSDQPQMRIRKSVGEANDFYALAKKESQSFVIQGIRKSFLDRYPELSRGASPSGEADNLTLVIDKGQFSCLGTQDTCKTAVTSVATAGGQPLHVQLKNGHLLPGLTVVTNLIGLKEMANQASTGNGAASVKDVRDPASIDHAKYGVYLDGKGFARARIGGVTRVITPPELGSDGMLQGVSVGLRTSGTRTLLDGGIFRDDVGLHVVIGDANKAQCTIKRDFPNVNIVLNGGHAAPLLRTSLQELYPRPPKKVAKELAEAGISIILSATRLGFATWEGKDYLVGPPLTRSPASILSEASVLYGIAVKGDTLVILASQKPQNPVPEGDSRIQSLSLEAAWAAKYAGLRDREATRLVSRNVEAILGLEPSKDVVLWENKPLQFGASVVLSFEESQEGRLAVAACWPDDAADDSI
ncbi:hypothetical protein PG996_014536 [Apiospora saccharicola]|uniref:Amidohydrolase-related domain-containing protein n=1 Tax=Apiospora saccharicola TaxID=335842 RepID=A0ABR1TIS6_9PEZI